MAVQSQRDPRGIRLDRVGVANVGYPMLMRTRAGAEQAVSAEVDLFVGLHAHQRGAHLSSLIETLEARRTQALDLDGVVELARAIRRGQDALGLPTESAEVHLRFGLFLSKSAPATGASAVLRYDCGLSVKLGQDAAKRVLVKVPIATVCPCSLEMSELGAHNQRAELSIQVWQALEDQRMVWLEDLIALGEASGSGQVHTLLHTGDEKLVTDQMFRRPRFVEDVVRETVGALQRELRHVRYQVRCESMESIHAHNAVAEVSGVS